MTVPGPSVLPALCLVRAAATASIAPEPVPHLDRLLALALECTVEHEPPPSLQKWLDRARAVHPSAVWAAEVQHIGTTIAELRDEGMDVALHWIANEVRTLVAPSDEDELNLSLHPPPPPLLRASPLGLFVRRTALRFAQLDFAQTAEWWTAFDMWCEGLAPMGKRPLAAGHRSKREVPEFARARLRQDYHAARELVRTFVPAGPLEPTAQQALLHLALIEYEDGGMDAAQLALDEATQISRTVGDARCLSACGSLRLRLDAASRSRAVRVRADPDSPYDLLWEITQRCSSGAALPDLFAQLFLAQASAQSLAFPRVSPSSSKTAAESPLDSTPKRNGGGGGDAGNGSMFAASWHCVAAQLWQAMGITSLARVHDSLTLSLLGHNPDTDSAAAAGEEDAVAGPGPTSSSSSTCSAAAWTLRLAVLARRTEQLLHQGRPEAAYAGLLRAVRRPGDRAGMGRREGRRWRAVVERCALDRARDEGDDEGESPDEYEPPPRYEQLQRAATTAERAARAGRVPARLDALLNLVDGRLEAGGGDGERERGSAELEEAWTAILALEEEEAGEGVRWVRAREVRARMQWGSIVDLVAGATVDPAPLEDLVTELHDLAQRYLALSRPRDGQRLLLAAAQLADHLAATFAATSAGLDPHPNRSSSRKSSEWEDRRDELARQWLAVDRDLHHNDDDDDDGGGPAGGEGAVQAGRRARRREQVERIVGLVGRAVEGALLRS